MYACSTPVVLQEHAPVGKLGVEQQKRLEVTWQGLGFGVPAVLVRIQGFSQNSGFQAQRDTGEMQEGIELDVCGRPREEQ